MGHEIATFLGINLFFNAIEFLYIIFPLNISEHNLDEIILCIFKVHYFLEADFLNKTFSTN